MKRPTRAEQERLKDLRGWLGKHSRNPEVPQRHKKYYNDEQVLKHLLRGAHAEDDALREVETALHFAATHVSDPAKLPLIPRGHNSKSLHKSRTFTTALRKLEEYDGEGRWCRGLNAMTLLTEYRRKIIFHAMLGSQDVDEDRSVAREKLDSYLASWCPELLEDVDATACEAAKAVAEQSGGGWRGDVDVSLAAAASAAAPASPPRKPIKPIEYSSNTTTSSDKRRKAVLQRQAPKNHHFEPKWGEFDTMRNRWRFLQPQVKQLRGQDDCIPTSPEKLVRVHSVPVRGTARELDDFMRHLESRK